MNLVTGYPIFENTAGTAAPSNFIYRQDAAIAAGNLPVASQFGPAGGTEPAAYTIQSDDGSVTLPAMTLPGTLTVIANNGITQTAPLSVAGNSTFSGGAGPISLTKATNAFGGIVSASNTGANAIQLTGGGAIQLGTVTTSNTFSVNAASIQETGGAIDANTLSTQSATGTTLNGANKVLNFTAANVTSGDIQLTNAAIPLTITAPGISEAGGNVQVTNTGGAGAGTGILVTGPISDTFATGTVSLQETAADIQETGQGTSTRQHC